MLDIRELKMKAKEQKQTRMAEQKKLCLEELEAIKKDLETEIVELMIKGVTEYSLMPLRRYLTDRGYQGDTINEAIKSFFGGSEIKLKTNGDYYIVL